MIGFLNGKVAGFSDGVVLIDVNGVGYRVACSATTLSGLPPVGHAATVHTHLHVREDVLALYGFATESERTMFEALLGVSGVGPKVALAVCSTFTPEAFRKALVTDDSDAISSVPGLGKKTAARIILDLKEKLELPDLGVVGSQPDVLAQARSALQNLGYSPAEVRSALAGLEASAEDEVESVVRSALKVLA